MGYWARMRVRFYWAILLCLLWTTLSCASEPAVWQRGVTIVPRWESDLSSTTFRQSVQQAIAANAGCITLQIIHWQTNTRDTDILSGGNTPTDASLIDAIRYIRSQGLQVAFKMQVLVADGEWSARINPEDRDAWFRNYQDMLLHYAQIGQSNGVQLIIIGSELTTVTSNDINPDNTRRWRLMIAAVRKAFKGKLTYSANWGPTDFPNEKRQIKFWDALDYLGISGYYELGPDASVDALLRSWDRWERDDLHPFQKKWNKPVIFTEIGYKSVLNAQEHPWKYDALGPYDPGLQANLYDAMFTFWTRKPYVAGVQLWDWSSDPQAGGPGDLDYTPKGKQAYAVLTEWFGRLENSSREAINIPLTNPPSASAPAATQFTTK
jgi:hypothetical protein